MTTPSQLAPGLEVRLLPGHPSGLLLSNTGKDSATVLGRAGEPCMRVGPAGVAVNVNCETWPEFGRAHGPLAATAAGREHWVNVSKAPRYSWIDPRTAGNYTQDAVVWSVPLSVGGRKVAINGVTRWIPAPSGAH